MLLFDWEASFSQAQTVFGKSRVFICLFAGLSSLLLGRYHHPSYFRITFEELKYYSQFHMPTYDKSVQTPTCITNYW